MSIVRSLAVSLSVALAVQLVPSAAATTVAATACTTTWVAPSSGVVSLATPSSWSTGLAPTPSDVVCFPSTVAIRVQGGTTAVAGWDVAAGGSVELDFGAVVTVTGAADLGGVAVVGNSRLVIGTDTYVDSGETLGLAARSGAILEPVAAGAALTIRDGAQVTVDSVAVSGVDIVNRGTLTVNGRVNFARLGLRPGTTLTNTGTIALDGPATINAEAGSPTPTVRNAPGGAVVVDGPAFVPLAGGGIGAAAQFVGAAFTNDGMMLVRSGQGALSSSGIHGGRFQVDAGAQLGISGSSNVFGPGSSVTGEGTVRVSVFSVPSTTTSVSVDSTAGFDPAELHLATGRIAVEGDRTLPVVRIQGGGALDVRGDAVIDELLAVQPGQAALFGGTGTLTIAADAALTFSGGNGVRIEESVEVVNEGEVRQASTGISVGGTASVVNRGLWTITESADIGLATGTRLRNEGRMTIDGPADTQLGFAGTLDNVGEIDVRSGRVDFRSTGVAQVAAGTLAGGTWKLAAGTTWLGFPAVTAIDGATVVMGGEARFLRFTSGPITAFDDLARVGGDGRLDLLDGASLDTVRGVRNGLEIAGVVSLSGGASVTTDTLTIGDGAEVRLELGTASPGRFAVAGAADLGGAIFAGQGPTEIVEAIYPFVTSSSISGAFGSVTGPSDPPVSVRRVGSTVELVVGDAPPLPLPTATLAGATVGEASTAAARVVLAEPAGPGGVTVEYETLLMDGGPHPAARPGVDFEPVTDGRATIPAGEVEAELIVPVIDDDVNERPSRRAIGVRVTGGVTVEGDALVTIDDDDPIPALVLTGDVLAERDVDTTYDLVLEGDGVTDWDRCLSTLVAASDAQTISDDIVAGPDGLIGELTVSAGAASADVAVTVVGDEVAESAASFEIEVRDGCGPGAATADVVAAAIVDIIDDDGAVSALMLPPLLGLNEGTSGTFTLQLIEATPVDRVVQMVIAPASGSPIETEDLDPLAADGRLVIPAGAPFVTLPAITARADDRFEDSEFAVVQIRDGATLIAEGGVQIVNTDLRPTIRVVDSEVVDGAASIREGTTSPLGVRDLVVDLELSIPTEVPLGFRIAAVGGTATVLGAISNSDQVPVGADVIVPLSETGVSGVGGYIVAPGDGRRSVTVGIVEDGRAEADEAVVLAFDAARPREPTSTVTYTLLDDDPRVRLEEFPAVDEGVTRPVMLDVPVPMAVDRVVDVRIVPGSATADDFVGTSATVTVPAGASEVELPPVVALADDIYEPTQALDYQVVDEQGELVDRRTVGIINLTPIPTASIIGPTTFTEGSRGVTRIETVTARLDRASEIDLLYTVEVDGEVVPVPPTSFRFPRGTTAATMHIGIVEDVVVEADQSFTIEAASPSRRPVEMATFTIVDDDEVRTLPIITELQFGSDTGPGTARFDVRVEVTNPTGRPLSLSGLEVVGAPRSFFDDAVGVELSGSLEAGESQIVGVTGTFPPRVVPGGAQPTEFQIRVIAEPDLVTTAGVPLLAPRLQFRLLRGIRDVPPFGGFYVVRYGAAMGSHRFEADTTPPSFGAAPRIDVSTTSAGATVPVVYERPPASDDSEAAFVARECFPLPGSQFPVNATTVVTCTARDVYDNESSVSFEVAVGRARADTPAITPAGQVLPISGDGFIPRGRVRIVLRSEPVLLAEVMADGNGRVERTVTLPADTTPGAHTVTLEGSAPGGTPRLVVFTVEVSRPCTITGTARSDVIVGTRGDDVICAGGGDDLVLALAGDDVVLGGTGDDLLVGGGGDDHLDGGAGFDRVMGGRGRDELIGEVRWP